MEIDLRVDSDMEDPKVDIYFRGDIAPGQKIVEVRQRLQKLFNADEDQLQRLFSGRPVIVRRNIDLQAAAQYREAMLKAGALVELRPIPPDDDASPTTAGENVSERGSDLPNDKITNRAAGGEEVAKEPLAGDISSEIQKGGTSTQSIEQHPRENVQAVSEFSLAPVGADMLNGDEREEIVAVEVDISVLSAEEITGDILKEDEKKRVDPIEIDTSHLTVEKLPTE
jgi:hypothetical protein